MWYDDRLVRLKVGQCGYLGKRTMKRLVCSLLVVSIACVGCDEKISTTSTILSADEIYNSDTKEYVATSLPIPTVGHDGQKDRMSLSTELRKRLERVEIDQMALMARIDDIHGELKSQRAEERKEKDLLVRIYPRIADIEARLESQRAEIESAKTAQHLYEVAIEAQRLTIETLQKLCRMYEAEIESQGKSRSSEESPLGKEPETGKH